MYLLVNLVDSFPFDSLCFLRVDIVNISRKTNMQTGIYLIMDVLLRKNICSFRFCPNEGGGAAQGFWHLFISAFLVNKSSLFSPKCQ